MPKKDVFTNHTLKEYRKKYGKLRGKLIKVTRKEVKDFDKAKPTKTKDFLVEGKKWWLIDGSYYEVPRPFTRSWFRNIKAPIKALVVLILLAGITYGTLKGLRIIDPVVPTYSVTFDCCEGMIGSESIKTINGKSVIEVAPNPKREGYVFDGWWGKREVVNSEYIYKDKISFPYELKENTTMYCKWNIATTKECKIILEYDTGKYLNPLSFNVNTEVTSLEIPTKQDYKFNYWTYENGDKVVLPFTITKDLKLKANWTQDAFTVTLHTNGGSQPGGTTYVSEDTYSLSHLKSLTFEPVTEKADQTFMGWYTDSGCTSGNEYKFGSPITKNIDLYAKWGKGREYTVTFNTNGGSAVSSITCSHISTSPISTREHYILKGWSTDNSSTGIVDFTVSGGYQVTKDQTLHAIWEQSEFNVELYDGDTLKERRNFVTKIDNKPNFAKKDHALENWYLNSKFTGEKVTFPLDVKSKLVGENKTLKLYAKYERNAYKVNVYDDDYSTSTSPTLAASYDSVSTLHPNYKPSINKPNKTISKFYIRNDSLSDYTIEFNNEKLNDTTIKQYIDASGVLNIYTHWETSSYNLTLKYPKIEGRTEAITNKIEIKKQDPETKVTLGDNFYKIDVKDYTFKGWSETEGGKTVSSITLTEDKTIYAIYEQKMYSLVTQYKCGDTVLKDPITIEHLDDKAHNINIIPKEDVITKDSKKYAFVKMSIDGTEITGKTFTLEKDSICVVEYSQFVDVDLYYQIGKTVESTPYATLKNQSSIKLSSLTRPELVDCTFSHYADEDGNTLTGTVNACTLKNHKIILVYTKTSFTVTLNPTGGDIAVDKIEHIKDGSTISNTVVGTPTKGTMTFEGWYKEEACENKFKFAEESSPDKITEDITLYAKWSGTETTNTTINFTISDEDYAKGARFYNAGKPIEQQTLQVIKAQVGSMDYGYLVYSGHAIDYWEDTTTHAREDDFPIKDGNTHTLVAKFKELATHCSLQANAVEGKFSDNKDTKLFTPEIGQTFKDFKDKYATDLVVTYANHTFVYWTIYDIVTESYVPIDDNYTFSSNIFIYAHYVDTIEEKGEKEFVDSNWATVSYYANQGLAKLKEFYNITTTMVGETKTVTYNGKSYGVVVVGENHDTITSSNATAALTFAFSEAISLDCYGTTTYTSTRPTNRWSCAIIRDKLHGEIKEKFDEQLSKNVKKVDKITMKGGSDSDYGTYATSSDEFFLFSAYELNLTASEIYQYVFKNKDSKTQANAGLEGTPYSSYFTSATKRKFKYGSDYTSYWIRSPYNDEDSETGHWGGPHGSLINCITTDGGINTNYKLWYPDNSKGIVPGFCIGVGE